DGEIVPHGEVAEDLHRLEGASDAEPGDLVGLEAFEAPTPEKHSARVGTEQVGDQVEDGSLARAVGTDEADHRARRHLERAGAHRADAAEDLGQPRYG